MARFVVQEHHASHLHYDFRLEVDGVFKSWAVPKGPSMNPKERRLAIRVEDHALSYGSFEGIIPEGYGAGAVVIWDRGAVRWIEPDPVRDLHRGKVRFFLKGRRLRGEFTLVRARCWGEKSWLLMKRTDRYAKRSWRLPLALTPSKKRSLKVRAPACGETLR